MNLINRFLWHYWWGQSQYLKQRLDELDAEKNNMREDRRKVRARLMKADARVITYAQIGDEMKDQYRGDGGSLNDYDQGWNDGVEAVEKAFRAENAALAEMKAKLREECEAWKAFALHQMHCAVCSEAIADCDIGMPLYHAARKEAK